MPLNSDDTAKMKELVCKLPGVLDAELKPDDSGGLRDIHILSDSTRSAKQTVRDVLAALSARYSLEVDHRIVSVAQIPAEFASAAERRVRYSGLDISCAGESCSVKVRLSADDREFSGEAAGGIDRLGRYRAAADATARALNCYLEGRASVRLEDVRLAELPAGAAVICSVSYFHSGGREPLVGSSIDRDDGGVCAVRATLNALNRRLALACRPQDKG